ncbi:MAG: TIGR03087 family PEP-CTERM/XrtA system glycosyltransferase [Gammaproteobacteria bacterium]|nr:TIGR03087 family PEP-CTERM/XrtA system glycosyltransferase [Gammaproteobacteria bacterium]
MTDVLLLTHRIPWPPDKGDKIRSYNILCHLAEKFRLHLGTFVDSAEDWQYVSQLEARCQSVCVRPAGRLRTAIRGLSALRHGAPVTVAYYDDRRLSEWVSDVAKRHSLDAALVFSAGMARHVKALPAATRKVLDMVDVDSEKWHEYARLKGWPRSWIYEREAQLLSKVEVELVSRFDRTLLVSQQEAGLLKKRCPQYSNRVGVMANGVDADYFSPATGHANPYPGDVEAIVFTGAMDYWANIEGVQWFASSVFPLIRQQAPRARFYVVGSRPTREVRGLENTPGVVVTGRVPDVRPFLAHARLAVAPLRVARGLQNKVLEAMAMARPVVATTAAMLGIDYRGPGVRTADTAGEFSQAVLQHLSATEFLANRRFVVEHFSWAAALAQLDQALLGENENSEVEIV